jgi:hypothetical protein
LPMRRTSNRGTFRSRIASAIVFIDTPRCFDQMCSRQRISGRTVSFPPSPLRSFFVAAALPFLDRFLEDG